MQGFRLTSFSVLTDKTRPLPINPQSEDQMIKFKDFLRDQSGATAIEYGLIAAGIAVAIIAVVQGLGSKLNSTFTSVQNALN